MLKKVEAMLAEAQRERIYGTIELQLREGEVELIRTSKTEKVPVEQPNGYKRR